MDFSKEIARGAALLDRFAGADWYNQINLNTLELSSICDCVLGQTICPEITYDASTMNYNNWYNLIGNELFQGNAWQAGNYGFDIHVLQESSDWNDLTEQWKELIEKRRAEDGTMV